ncbi:MAG: bifunctional riboflavin kinase/FAD synthetase [Alphaproteobacteria bacterium]|nr:bifunctional riboflavin kinase/FAD synthetase [Alphaproteobacteria bacterium]
MKVFQDPLTVPGEVQGGVLALGNFDGVHRGHQAVIGEGLKLGREQGRRAGVMTFEPHPRRFFQPGAAMFTLTPAPQKLKLFEALGCDFTGVMAFDAKLAGMSGEAFVRDVLHGIWRASHVVVGYNFFFGKGRSGSPQLLSEIGREIGFGVTIVSPASDEGEVFSSSAVRNYLRAGDVRGAAGVLGYWWTVMGTVESGAGIGKGLGFPTANVMLEPGQDLHHGIYATRVRVDGRRFDAAAYLGRRPTFDNGIAKLEVYLFDFDENLYGREIDVELIAFIRPDQAFESPEALVRQMDDDCARARAILAEVNEADPMRRYPIGRVMVERFT